MTSTIKDLQNQLHGLIVQYKKYISNQVSLGQLDHSKRYRRIMNEDSGGVVIIVYLGLKTMMILKVSINYSGCRELIPYISVFSEDTELQDKLVNCEIYNEIDRILKEIAHQTLLDKTFDKLSLSLK